MARNQIERTTIANGASLSGAIEFKGRPLRIIMPSAWTTANLTFQTSYDGVNYANLYDDSGNEETVTAAASREIDLDDTVFAGVAFMKIRSGNSGTPVNQGAQRELIVVAAPE
jgi:hypothetical protein